MPQTAPSTTPASCETPPAAPSHNRFDMQLLRWMLLCVSTLGATAAFMMLGVLETLDLEQIRLLAGHPFYMEAAVAQVSLLPPYGIFGICTALTLFLSAALLRSPGLARRTQICFLAALATLLPGFLCILWDGVLYMAAPLFCVLLLWLLAALLPAIYSCFAKS